MDACSRGALAAAGLLWAGLSMAGEPLSMRVDTGTVYQAWEGWGGTAPIELGTPFDTWVNEPTAAVFDAHPVNTNLLNDAFREKLLDDIAFDMGLTRFRLEVGPQVEIENDNDDPAVANLAAYRFAWQDAVLKMNLLPLKRRIESRGERMVLYVSYDLRSRLTKPFLLQPAEYAEMAEVFLAYLKREYGIEPDYWSVINEPTNKRPGPPKLYAELTAATGARIAKAGFKTRMSGPECVTPKQVPAFLQAFVDTPGALDHFAQLTYHLYWDPNTVEHREAIAAWAARLKVPTAQTEWCEQKDLDVARHIWLDLTVTGVSAWERYAWGAQYTFDRAHMADMQTVVKASTAWYQRQFTRYIRPGAVRVRVESADPKIKPVAFLSPGRRAVLVVINEGDVAQPISVSRLPAGIYDASYTAARQWGVATNAIAVAADGTLDALLPPGSVSTFTADPPQVRPGAMP